MADVHALLREFDGERPIERATTPPSSWYVDRDFFDLERRRVWQPSWQPLAHREQLSRTGDFVASCRLGEPVVVVRGDDGALRALRNACLHHGAEVARGTGQARHLVCPYHGWSYDLQGRLHAMPRAGDIDGLAPGEDGLAPLPVATHGPLVWTAAGERPPSGGPLPARLESLLEETGWARLRWVGQRTYALHCNWKVFVDNYLDGGYHVAALHRGLGAQLDATSYRTEVYDGWALQRVDAAAEAAPADGRGGGDGPDFAERIGHGALYAWLYPNVMLNRYGPFLDTNWVIPVAPDRTVVVFDDFIDPEAVESAAARAGDGDVDDLLRRAAAASEAVQREDEAICESVQRSLASRAFDRGRYAPSLEHAMYAFHRWLAADLAGAPDAAPRTPS